MQDSLVNTKGDVSKPGLRGKYMGQSWKNGERNGTSLAIRKEKLDSLGHLEQVSRQARLCRAINRIACLCGGRGRTTFVTERRWGTL